MLKSTSESPRWLTSSIQRRGCTSRKHDAARNALTKGCDIYFLRCLDNSRWLKECMCATACEKYLSISLFTSLPGHPARSRSLYDLGPDTFSTPIAQDLNGMIDIWTDRLCCSHVKFRETPRWRIFCPRTGLQTFMSALEVHKIGTMQVGITKERVSRYSDKHILPAHMLMIKSTGTNGKLAVKPRSPIVSRTQLSNSQDGDDSDGGRPSAAAIDPLSQVCTYGEFRKAYLRLIPHPTYSKSSRERTRPLPYQNCDRRVLSPW